MSEPSATAEALELTIAPAAVGVEAQLSPRRFQLPGRWAHPTVRASFWTIFCYGATQSLRLGSNIVLSRLLFPEAFGVMTIVNVFMQGLQMFSDIGIGPSIIQHRRGDDPLFLNTAWTLQVVRGMALGVCSALLAWPMAEFYGQPQLVPLICAAGLTAALSGFNATYLFSVRRTLNLGGVTFIEIASQASGIAVNCVWAWLSPSVWALMSGAVITSGARMVLSQVLQPRPRNRLAWDRQAYGELLHFGKWIFLSTIVTFCAMQTDRILLSKLIPLETLGVYTIALTVATLPNVLLGTLTFSVLYPLLCQAGREASPQVERRLRTARGVLLSLGLAMVLAVGVGADVFYRVLYDSRYYDAIWMTHWMCGAVWLMVLNTTLETSLLALGDSRTASGCGVVKFAACTAASLVGYHTSGVPGFIVGLAIGTAAGQAALLWALARHGIHVVAQDLRFTAMLTVAAGLAALAEGCVDYGSLLVGAIVLGAVAARLWKYSQR
ncbi:MAG TPA: oligosaccharide flippase family protein [Pirellulales bacterium]|nr:oligosaccharide flippase family protein [Pirellulales bacterium]